MARSEPTLIPEWLKNAGNSNGGLSQLNNHTDSGFARNNSFVNHNDRDSGRYFSSSERTASSYFRRSSSSNGAGRMRSQGSFGRNHRERDRDKGTFCGDKDKIVLRDPRVWDFPDTSTGLLSSKFERDGLRHSQSTISGKRGETWPKKVVNDTKNENGHSTNNGDVLYKTGSVGKANNQNFERDFPSLGADGKKVASDIDRVSSPGLGSALQSLPIGTSVKLGGEKWTSALAEVPVLEGSSETGTLTVQQTTGSKSIAAGLNMAEAVLLGPSRARTPPQSSETQKLEELVIKQSRQLVPLTPSLPKTLASISSDKQKNKASQHQFPASSSPSLNHSPRGVPAMGSVLKESDVGKLHVLKSGREKNGGTDKPSPKNVGTARNSTVSSASVSVTRVPPVKSAPDRSKFPLTVLERKPTYQAKTRNDFFNSVRKQSKGNSYSPDSNMSNSSDQVTSPSLSDKFSEIEVVATACDSPQLETNKTTSLKLGENHSSVRGDEVTSNNNGDGCDVPSGKKNCGSDPIISEEEEAAFLRSLGWEENDDEEGGLTEEEISDFYRDFSKYIINSDTSLGILQGVKHKLLLLPQFSGGLSSTDAKMES